MYGQIYPNQSYPGQPYPNQSYPSQSYPSQPYSGQQMPMRPQPSYRQISAGAGINQNECNQIVSGCTRAYMENAFPLSRLSAQYIRQSLGGEWFVTAYDEGQKIDFSLSLIKGGDYMSFILDNTEFQVCRLR